MNFITKNLTLKIMAFLLALMFWFHVITDKTYDREFNVPLKLQGISSELILTTPPPESIKVRLEGTGKQLLRFLMEKPTLIFAADRFESGIYSIDLSPHDLTFDRTVTAKIVSVSEPNELKLRFERLAEKEVDVEPEIEITPALGFSKIGELKVLPNKVSLRGPWRVIRSMNSIPTRKLVLKDVKKDVNEKIDLALDDSLYLTAKTSVVTIIQNIGSLAERRVGPIKLRSYNAERFDSTHLSPDSIILIVEGFRDAVDSLSLAPFSAAIDFRNIQPGTSVVMPLVFVPKEYRLIATDPVSVTVTAYRK